MYVCMYVCVYVCMNICMYICMYVYMYLCVHMYVCIVCMYVCVCVSIHIYKYLCKYESTRAYVYVCTNVWIYGYMHGFIYLLMSIYVSKCICIEACTSSVVLLKLCRNSFANISVILLLNCTLRLTGIHLIIIAAAAVFQHATAMSTEQTLH